MGLAVVAGVIFHVVVVLYFLQYSRRSTEALEKVASDLRELVEKSAPDVTQDYLKGRLDGLPKQCHKPEVPENVRIREGQIRPSAPPVVRDFGVPRPTLR